MTDRMDVIFSPRSVALIGASRDVDSMSGTLVANLLASYSGPLYLINPKAREIGGRAVYASIREVPGPVDLAFIAVPAAYVSRAIDECLEKSVRGLVIITAGFAETGAAGRAAERQLVERLRAVGVPFVGPNCLGVLNGDAHRPLNGTFSLAAPPLGDVGVCTQSGALGFVFPDYMRRWRLGLAQLISLGNKADIGENDVLEHWLHEPHVTVVQLYLESFQEPRRFVEVARKLGRVKPIVALKAGRSDAGQRAAGSHTAALASPTALSDATLRQAGVVRVDHLPELFDATALLAMQPPPRGRRVAVLTNAGGPGVLCADALEAAGLTAPPFSAELRERLARLVPPQASVANPIDLIGSTSPEEYAACLELLLASDEVDSIVVIYVPRLADTSAAIARAIVTTAGSTPVAKTLAAVFLESTPPPSELGAGPVHIPAFEFPERAARALAHAESYARWRDLPDADVLQPLANAVEQRSSTKALSGASESSDSSAARQTRVRDVVHGLRESIPIGGGWLDIGVVHEILGALEIDAPRWCVARSIDDVESILREWGVPVTMKALAPSVLHKARLGGVVNDVRSVEEAAEACEKLLRVAADVEQVLVQEYVGGGVEALVGLQRDSLHGPVVALGRGGVNVERDRAVALRMLPLTRHDLRSLIADSTLTDSTLAKSTRADSSTVERLERLVVAMADLAEAWPELAEVDWNPVKLVPGRGPCVVDARMRVTG